LDRGFPLRTHFRKPLGFGINWPEAKHLGIALEVGEEHGLSLRV
jgi:hypothetical protein